jgi:hypothetical protein
LSLEDKKNKCAKLIFEHLMEKDKVNERIVVSRTPAAILRIQYLELRVYKMFEPLIAPESIPFFS